MGYIYISYSRQNGDTAQRLVQELQQRGYTVWIDTEDLAPGTRWYSQVDAAIHNAEVFIVLLSPAAQNRTIQNEIDLAHAAGKPIIPVLLEQTSIPTSLANHQIVNASGDWDVFMQRLVNAVDASTASLQIRRGAPAPPITAPAAAPAMPMARAPRKGPNTGLIVLGLLGIGITILIILGLLGPAVGNVFSNITGGLESGPTSNASTNTAVDQVQFTEVVPTLPAFITDLPSPTVTAATAVRTADANPTADSTEQFVIRGEELTSTALANFFAGVTQTAEARATEVIPTLPPPILTATIPLDQGGGAIIGPPPSGSEQLYIRTEVAAQVDATVAAVLATENSLLSPAEAAQIASFSGNNNSLIFLVGLVAASALGVAITVLVVLLTGSTIPRSRPRPAHHHMGASGQPQAVLPKMLLEDYQIFTSSSEKDKEWVRILVEDLEALGYAVWWYAKDAPGLPFGNEIRSAIYHTKVFLIVLSPDSMQSKHVEEEIRWAEIYDRPIIPVECRPTSIEARFYGLAKGSDIDFTVEIDYKESLEYLAQAIDHHLQQRLEQLNIEDSHGSD